MATLMGTKGVGTFTVPQFVERENILCAVLKNYSFLNLAKILQYK